MQVFINNKPSILKSAKVGDNFDKNKVVVVDGYAVDSEYLLSEGQSIIVVTKGVMPAENELEHMMLARNGSQINDKLKNAKVCIIGLGGLGSNIAIMLVRAGVGRLKLVDFDIVEPTNLNRQQYYISHLGMKKTQAMHDIIKQINPYAVIECIHEKVNESNICEIVGDCDYVCEAVDQAQTKAMITREIMSKTHKILVASSGMAGWFSSNSIVTTKRLDRLYICGDMINSSGIGQGLMSPRVAICAGHQANMIIRLILGEDKV